MASVTNARRYALLKAFEAERRGDTAIAMAFRGTQRGLAGTDLATTFPLRAKLVAVGYLATEDIAGADVDELTINAGLSRSEAAAVIAALG